MIHHSQSSEIFTRHSWGMYELILKISEGHINFWFLTFLVIKLREIPDYVSDDNIFIKSGSFYGDNDNCNADLPDDGLGRLLLPGPLSRQQLVPDCPKCVNITSPSNDNG